MEANVLQEAYPVGSPYNIRQKKVSSFIGKILAVYSKYL
jgi:hypothetical protein